MDLKIANKTALITGSTQGIGFATAKKLCEEGANVIINGRNKKTIFSKSDCDCNLFWRTGSIWIFS